MKPPLETALIAKNLHLAQAKSGVFETVLPFLRDETGQDLIEYALVAALIGLGAVASVKTLAPVISNAYNSVGNKLSSDI